MCHQFANYLHEKDCYQNNGHTTFMHLSVKGQNDNFDDVFWKLREIKMDNLCNDIIRPDNDDQ